jgi:phosphopantothenoylcysteine decarboxylase/phosphopantothenate--cysteine ligase
VIARLAHGIANDLLTTLVLATEATICIAPAMNGQMWRHAATQANLDLLQQRGTQVLMPESGSLACGEVDTGRMPEPASIIDWLADLAVLPVWQGKKVLITAGPTVEDIDPVRFIANRSSGKMGYALAQAARAMGAEVCLISGPTQLRPPSGVTFVAVRSAREMLEAVQRHFNGTELMLAAAAVADYRVEQIAEQKLKKQGEQSLTLTLVQNPDIVAWAAAQTNRGKVIAFAAETENLLAHAQAKLQRKGVDAVLANSVAEGAGFDQAQNQLLFVSHQRMHEFPLAPKGLLAQQVLSYLAWTDFLT